MKIKKDKNITIIAAIGKNNELGFKNKLIWKIKYCSNQK